MECNVKVVTKMEFLITMPLLFQVKGFYTKNWNLMWRSCNKNGISSKKVTIRNKTIN